MPRESLTLALWAVNLGHPVAGLDAWLGLVDRQMAEAKRSGAELFVLPEYVSAHWLAERGSTIAPDRVIAHMAEIGASVLPELENLARRHDMGLIAGSMPVACGTQADGSAGFVNRAWILLPEQDGRVRRHRHDKIVLTPGEQDRRGWHLATGAEIGIHTWRDLRFTVLICLDIEMPRIADLLIERNLDLVIVPSMTSQMSGYHRVFDCAKARAIELYAAVGAVGCIGNSGNLNGAEANCSGAALYLPCEMAFAQGSGSVDSVGPFSGIEGPGPVLIATAPIGELRRRRKSGAEVWQGRIPAFPLALAETAE